MSYVDPGAVEEHIASNLTLLQGGKGPKRFKRERFDDIEPQGTEWLVKHFLPAHGVAIIYGVSTVGKSFVVLYFALRICMGKTILGHRTRKSGVLYVAAEGQNGMRKRIKALRDKFDMKTSAFQFIGDGVNLLNEEHVDALCVEACAARDEMVAEAGVELGLIVVDTTSAAMPGGNENSGEDMSRVLAAGQRIGQAAGALVLFVAHPGKNETLGVRGWSGQTGNIDAQIYLSVSEGDPKLRQGLVQKLKDGEDGETFSYRLKEIEIGVDADGDKITSAYPVFETGGGEVTGRRKQPPALKPGPTLLLRALSLLIDEGQGCLVPPVPGVPAGTQGVKRTALRERVIRLGYAEADDKPDTIKRSVNRDINVLLAVMAIRAEGDLLWLAK
jgi:hypothetical protein